MNTDALALLGQDNITKEVGPVFIYRVYFDMTVSIEEEDQENKMITLSDSIDTSAGPDAREAQEKVEQHVLHSGNYKIPFLPVNFLYNRH